MMQAFVRWADLNDSMRAANFQDYVHNVAQARFVTRRVLRIINESAKEQHLDPLAHQALLQIYGAPAPIAVHEVADKLDVATASASRIVKQLEERGLVCRSESITDRRVTEIRATEDGIDVLARIDEMVHDRVDYFQRQLGPFQRLSALAIFAFYVGVDAESPVARAILAPSTDAVGGRPDAATAAQRCGR